MARDSDQQRIRFGSAAGSGGSDPAARAPDTTGGAGFSLEGDRRRKYALQDQQEGASQPAVRPWIAISAIAVIPLFLLAILLKPSSGRAFDYNSEMTQYSEYKKKNPSALDPDQVRNQLFTIARLENANREDEAAREWANLMLQTRTDKNNPIYKLALRRLKTAK